MKTPEDIKREIAVRLMCQYMHGKPWFTNEFEDDPDYALLNHNSSMYDRSKRRTTAKINEFCDYAEQIYNRFHKGEP
jgi:hypothetical protein